MVKGFAHICLAAGDLAATERFYCDGLGFRKVFNFIRDGKLVGFYLEVAKRTFVEVFQEDRIDVKAPAPIKHLCLETDDLDALVAQVRSLGYEISDKKMGGDESWQSWTSDPAGVKIEFHQYTQKSHQFTGADCVLD